MSQLLQSITEMVNQQIQELIAFTGSTSSFKRCNRLQTTIFVPTYTVAKVSIKVDSIRPAF